MNVSNCCDVMPANSSFGASVFKALRTIRNLASFSFGESLLARTFLRAEARRWKKVVTCHGYVGNSWQREALRSVGAPRHTPRHRSGIRAPSQERALRNLEKAGVSPW